MNRSARPPGPRGLPVIGSLLHYFKDILGFLTKNSERYGDIVFFSLGPRNIYQISEPEYIKKVLITDSRNFIKSRALERAKMVVGEGLLTNEGESHLRNRRVIQPLFHKKAIPNYIDAVISHTENLCRVWEDDATVDINREMMFLTQSIVVDALFDSKVDREKKQLVDSLTTVMNSFPRLLFPFSEYLDKLPLPANYRFNKSISNLDEVVYSVVREKESAESNNYDLVSLLLSARDEEGNRFFTDRQIRDEVITFFIAGQETTANALSWAFYLIARNKNVEDRILEEIHEVLGSEHPSYDDIERLQYTRNVINETLRLYPPAWTVVRKALKGCEIGGYFIPAGSDIYMSQYVVHRDDRFFSDPLKFSPERWFEINSRNLPRFAYFPFGGGPRRCIGEPFAIMEAVLILAVVLREWSVELINEGEIKPKPLITIRPKNGVPVRLLKRTTSRRTH